MNINNVFLAGRITKNPEIKQTQKGTSFCSISLAVNKTWRDDSGTKKASATFVDCLAMNKLADAIAKSFAKGDEIYIQGELKLNSWTDTKTGQKRQKLYVLVSSFQFVGNHKEEKQEDNSSYPDDGETPF